MPQNCTLVTAVEPRLKAWVGANEALLCRERRRESHLPGKKGKTFTGKKGEIVYRGKSEIAFALVLTCKLT